MIRAGALLLIGGLLISAGASSQTYPTRTVRLIVAVAPGGNLDLVGRPAAQHLSTAFGRQVIVENRPGANSTIGLDNVARSAADGYTLGMIAPSFLVGPRMMRNPPFDPVRDFAPISRIAVLPQMLVPAISETLPGFQASIFNGMVAPTGTPPEILARIHGEVVKFTLSAENRQRFAKLGVELQSSPSPDHFAAFINSENVRFSRVIEQAGISPH